MAKNSFELEHPLEMRQAEAARIRETSYSDRIPVFSNTFGRGLSWVQTEKAVFVFVKNTLPPTAALMSAIYEEHKDEDGFLYMTSTAARTHLAPPKMQEPSL